MSESNQTTVDNWVDQAKAVEDGDAPSGSVAIKLTGENSVASPGPDEPKGEPYQKQHAKVLRFEISIGAEDDSRTLEEFEADIREALVNGMRGEPVHNVTLQGGYYIIDGKVCLPTDYDPATKNRKPGTFPPVWAGGPDPKKSHLQLVTDDTDDEGEREFVRVQPTIPRRDPLTGAKPRKPRSDRGVKKGPRKNDADKVKASDAIARMRAEGLNQ